MKNISRVFLVFVLSLLSCSTLANKALHQIRIVGHISLDTYIEVNKKISDKHEIREVVVSSEGGSALAGMAIGLLIQREGLNVRVEGYCVSSCANYIFPAGREKIISRDALIVFHGGFQQEGLLEEALEIRKGNYSRAESAKAQAYNTEKIPKIFIELFNLKENSTLEDELSALIELEKKYYKKLRVDERLPTFGHAREYKAYRDSGKYLGFYYSLKSLDKIGVKNISVLGGDWRPEDNPYISKVYMVELP